MRDDVRGVLGPVGPVGRKNSWQLSEFVGHSTPDGLRRLLAKGRREAVEDRDDLQDYSAEHLGADDRVPTADTRPPQHHQAGRTRLLPGCGALAGNPRRPRTRAQPAHRRGRRAMPTTAVADAGAVPLRREARRQHPRPVLRPGDRGAIRRRPPGRCRALRAHSGKGVPPGGSPGVRPSAAPAVRRSGPGSHRSPSQGSNSARSTGRSRPARGGSVHRPRRATSHRSSGPRR